MQLEQMLALVREQPDSVDFNQVIALIDSQYQFTPTGFSNGDVRNESGTNEGSCKILAFAQHNDLSQAETLALFGKYYREDVLKHPNGTDHGNIRNFIEHGWNGVKFDRQALSQLPTQA